eukprot:TRINITY_DN4033_c0_g1_i5.p1 TRINITY_DN4033_c0_g1~~TRINITY_DN4033_c0_g1_i5.p1  ORF type:complete len:214 (-),score=-8.45 TRINITY_DN4033_c0_g1_i5:45-686(-)
MCSQFNQYVLMFNSQKIYCQGVEHFYIIENVCLFLPMFILQLQLMSIFQHRKDPTSFLFNVGVSSQGFQYNIQVEIVCASKQQLSPKRLFVNLNRHPQKVIHSAQPQPSIDQEQLLASKHKSQKQLFKTLFKRVLSTVTASILDSFMKQKMVILANKFRILTQKFRKILGSCRLNFNINHCSNPFSGKQYLFSIIRYTYIAAFRILQDFLFES